MRIPLTQSKTALIDDADHSLVVGFQWHYAKNGYARTWHNGKLLYMHTLILQTPQGLFGDHINGDRLDNRRSNLRTCTPTQNTYNRKVRSDSSLGVKGVSKRSSGKYEAYMKVSGKKIYIGTFDTVMDAALARDLVARKHHQNFASLNLIKTDLF